MVKRSSSIGSMVKKRLSDIRTSLPQLKPQTDVETRSNPTRDYIDHLVKENIALVKIIQDRNKIIEMTATELKKLRLGVQRIQLQNWNLAQYNSQMLSELLLNKEKVKALQHELVCKEAVLKAKNRDLNETTLKVKRQDVKDMDVAEADKKTSKNNRKVQASRTRSTTSHSIGSKQAAEDKRHCSRRRSTRSRMQEQEPAKRLSEAEDIARHYNNRLANNDDNYPNTHSEHKCFCSRRTTLGTPVRRATGKVQSVSIKIKRTD